MAKKDIISNEYFEDKERFADLLNGYLFDGKNVIQPEDLTESNAYVARIQKINSDINAQAVLRDVVKILQIRMKIILIVLQNQSDIHYAMPVRLMNEEASSYHKQWRMIAKNHKKAQDLNQEEYLSGFSRHDRLKPIITIVVYFGSKPWDGPRNLRQMLDMDGIPSELRNLIVDYPIHVLEVRRFEHIENFQTDLQIVFGFLQNCEKKDSLKDYVHAHQNQLENLDQEAYDLISVMSHSKELKTIKQKVKTKPGGIDMCQGIKDMIKEGEERGEKRGKEQGIQLAKNVFRMKAQNISDEDIARKCRISLAKVRDITSDFVA